MPRTRASQLPPEKRKKPLGRKPKGAAAGIRLSVRLAPELYEAVKAQPDPRAFVEQAIRQALDPPRKTAHLIKSDDIERVPFED